VQPDHKKIEIEDGYLWTDSVSKLQEINFFMVHPPMQCIFFF
jgi:hypothetical protein